MTQERREQWECYFHHLMDLTGLRDKVLRIDSAPPSDPKSAAEFIGVDGRNSAWLRLATEWDTYTPEEQRYIAVHELGHFHKQKSDHFLKVIVKPRLTAAEWQAYELLEEYDHDGIMWEWAKHLPLPTECGITAQPG